MATRTFDLDTTSLTSDPHVNHRLTARLRGFAPTDQDWDDPNTQAAALAAHNDFLVDQWNTACPPGHTIIALGDMLFGNVDAAAAVFDRIHAEVFVVPGNHDSASKLIRVFGEDHVFPMLTTVRFHDTTADTRHKAVLCHFPIATWDGAEHGTPHLHGHLHTGMNGHRAATPHGHPAVRADVGVDSATPLWAQPPLAPIPARIALNGPTREPHETTAG
jgi:calcineurin-like phosphoesterase family protein